MDNSQILKHIDLTLLKPTATWDEIQNLCADALAYKTAAVCIPPAYVARVKAKYGDKLNICTAVGFPLGYSSAEVKVFETSAAVAAGADEIDMVVNLGDVKDRRYDKITAEIAAVKKAAGQRIVKVIVETCYLDETEKVMLCKCVSGGGADYIKTSTGFGSGGAALTDIALFKKHIGSSVKIKAAGGVRGRDEMAAFIDAGCERIGTSSITALV